MGFVTDNKPGKVAVLEASVRKTTLAALFIVIGYFTPGIAGVLFSLAGAIYMAIVAVRLFRR